MHFYKISQQITFIGRWRKATQANLLNDKIQLHDKIQFVNIRKKFNPLRKGKVRSTINQILQYKFIFSSLIKVYGDDIFPRNFSKRFIAHKEFSFPLLHKDITAKCSSLKQHVACRAST